MLLQGQPRSASILRSAALFVTGAAVFALAYGQAPLYFSNQNQYFLHGLASAGYGALEHDWLANTEDPTPLFSLLVEVTYRFGHASLFHVYYALLMGVYLASLLGLFNVLARERANPLNRMVFVALLLLLHSAVLRSASARIFGVDYPWYFQAGLAGQYVLGPMLQPSTFGVLLLLSLCFFARGKPYLAVTCSSLGGVCHSTYLLPAAMLTMGYLAVLVSERRIRHAFQVGVLALVLVLPSVIYNGLTFRPSSLENFAEAQRILVHFRIPHHTIPELWFDNIAAAQVGWLVLGIVLSWRSRLFPVLLISASLALALTLIQVATGSDALALLFPWRVSVILIPAATAIILTRLALAVSGRASSGVNPVARLVPRLSWAGGLLIVAVVVAGGVLIMSLRLAYQERDEELAMMEYVRAHLSPGDCYLLPVPIPELKASVRGSFKSDFKPLPALQKDKQFIPINLQRFRLHTGAPIFVDFKSIPYQDLDVLEWHERLILNDRICKQLKAGKVEEVLPELRQHGITHVVIPAHEALDRSQLPVVYEDEFYVIHQVPSTAME
jgi:hypothetical protein